MMLKLNRPIQLKRATHWVLALFVLSVLNMGMQMPVHAAMQQGMQMMQQQKADSVEPLQASHCEMQADQQPAVTPADMSKDDSCCCPPALCDAVQAQQDKLFQQAASMQLFASLVFYPISVELQLDTVQTLDVISLRYQALHYREITPLPLRLNTVLLI